MPKSASCERSCAAVVLSSGMIGTRQVLQTPARRESTPGLARKHDVVAALPAHELVRARADRRGVERARD